MGLMPKFGRKGKRDILPFSLDQYLTYFGYQGNLYGVAPNTTYGVNQQEEPPGSFEGIVQGAYKTNGVVFACMVARMALFSEARFQFRCMRNGRPMPGELFGNADLVHLEKPWPNGTTRHLLRRMIQDADLAGNFFAARRPGNRIKRMHPEWVTIVMGSESDPNADGTALDAEVVGYIYTPGGKASGKKSVYLMPEEVCHFSPIPDPTANYRGMSWLTPLIRDIMGHNAARDHKLKFFENAATPNMVVSLDKDISREQFEEWVESFENKHKGVWSAYNTLYLGGGADATVVGKDIGQMNFKTTQGADETHIAAAARIPPIIVGLSEGLESATYSNYGQARRAFADGPMRDLWGDAAGSLATITTVPSDSELWYDERDIAFLKEDQKDAAEIQNKEAQTIMALVNAGYTPESVVAAVQAGDFNLLEHTGLYSVQLQPPGTEATPQDQAGRALASLIAPYLPPSGNGHID